MTEPSEAAKADESELLDELADAIADSFDMDWNSSDGARAVLPIVQRLVAEARAMVAGEPVATKCPWCETCGKDVPEVLCPTCAKWWADNHPAPDTAALVELATDIAQINPCHCVACTVMGKMARSTLTLIAQHKGTEHG